MKVSHRISFPGGKEFEQHECVFEIDLLDLDVGVTDKMNPLQIGQLMYSLVVINGLLYQRAEGYIDKEEYNLRKERVFSLLTDEMKEKLMEALKIG